MATTLARTAVQRWQKVAEMSIQFKPRTASLHIATQLSRFQGGSTVPKVYTGTRESCLAKGFIQIYPESDKLNDHFLDPVTMDRIRLFTPRDQFNTTFKTELTQLGEQLQSITSLYEMHLANSPDDLQTRHEAARLAQAFIKKVIAYFSPLHPVSLALQSLRDVSVQDFGQALSYTHRIGADELLRAVTLNQSNFVNPNKVTHHVAIREIVAGSGTPSDSRIQMTKRLREKEREYNVAGLISSKEIWTENDYFIRGTFVFVPHRGHVKKVGEEAKGQAPVFCTVYTLKGQESLEPGAKKAMLKFATNQKLSPMETLNILLSKQIHPDIKAVVASGENGSMNHVAFDVQDIHYALDLTHKVEAQNRFQPGITMNQRSTLAVPTGKSSAPDYVEWVTQKPLPLKMALQAIEGQGKAYSDLVRSQHPELQELDPDTLVTASSGFTPGNAQRMFSSTLPGTLKAAFDLAQQNEWPLTDVEKIELIHRNLSMIDGIKNNEEEMAYYMSSLCSQFELEWAGIKQ